MFQPVALITFDFIVSFKLRASSDFFQGTKQMKVWKGKVYAVRRVKERFQHRLSNFRE